MSVKSEVGFLADEEAVIGLPLRIVVSLVIGMTALASIVSLITSVGVFSQPLVVSVSPMLGTVSGNGSQNVSFAVVVMDRAGHRIDAATVILSGLGGAGIGRTNASGSTWVQLPVSLQEGVWEGYLDVSVSAVAHPRYWQEAMVKIVRES